MSKMRSSERVRIELVLTRYHPCLARAPFPSSLGLDADSLSSSFQWADEDEQETAAVPDDSEFQGPPGGGGPPGASRLNLLVLPALASLTTPPPSLL